MIHGILEFIAKGVGVASKPGNRRHEWTFVFIIVVIGLALGVALFAVAR